jgi:hypothetical protein
VPETRFGSVGAALLAPGRTGLNLVVTLIELCETLLVMLVVSIMATVLEKGEPVVRRGRKAAGLRTGRWPGRRRSDRSTAPESKP